MKFREVVKAILAWFSVPFLLAHAKYIIPLITAVPFLFGMSLIWFTNEYRRTYDIDYEDKSETLAGIDANKNGMRDDLERFGEEVYKNWDPLVLKAYYNWLKNLYIVMKKNGEVGNDLKIKYMNSMACWNLLQDDKRITGSNVEYTQKRESLQITALSFNTKKRHAVKMGNMYLLTFYLSADRLVDLKYACVDLGLSNSKLFLLQKRSLTDNNGKVHVKQDLTGKFFNEKPRLYEDSIDFKYYKDKIMTRGGVYEEFYNHLNSSAE